MFEDDFKFHWFMIVVAVAAIGLILLTYSADFARVTGNKLIITTDKTRHVVCYRFAYHDGIYCMKDEIKKN